MLGSRVPRIRSVPNYSSTSGQEVADLCLTFGLKLDPWQIDVINDALGEDAAGNWVAIEVGLVVARQNGKSEIIIARMLAGLFLFGEEEIIYSAHRADTSMKIFQRFVKYLKRNKDIAQQIRSKEIKINNTHGQEGVTLSTGQTVGFRTRAQEGGRGFSADCIFFDEAFEISDDLQAAILPTSIARPNPQIWYAGTAVDQEVHHNGVVFARIRVRGIAGDDSLAYFEWSVEAELAKIDRALLDDHNVWAQTNPSLGYQANERMIVVLRGSMKARKFATECLCIGDWPETSDEALHVIDLTKWDACEDIDSVALDPVCFAYDVAPGQSSAAIASAGWRADGLPHVEIVEHKRSTGWVAKRMKGLKFAHSPTGIACDAAGPAGSINADVENEIGEEVHRVNSREHADAFGIICSAVLEEAFDANGEPTGRGRLRHLGTGELRAALEGATTRAMGDGGKAWSRKNSEVDISPLVAATLALWCLVTQPTHVPDVYDLNEIAERLMREDAEDAVAGLERPGSEDMIESEPALPVTPRTSQPKPGEVVFIPLKEMPPRR